MKHVFQISNKQENCNKQKNEGKKKGGEVS